MKSHQSSYPVFMRGRERYNIDILTLGGCEVAKIGRNQPCPCLSGKKYKHCHGSNDLHHMRREIDKILERGAASRIQREKQQGLGKPIISVKFGDHRLVIPMFCTKAICCKLLKPRYSSTQTSTKYGTYHSVSMMFVR